LPGRKIDMEKGRWKNGRLYFHRKVVKNLIWISMLYQKAARMG